jgi:MFS family permease
MFLSALNQTIVATALPTIGRDFGDFEDLSWVIIAYLLSSTVVSPLYGKLSDIYGRRGMMLVAIGLFIAGSVVAAASPDMSALIAGRTLQGIGGGGIVPLTQTTIADMVAARAATIRPMGSARIVAGVAARAWRPDRRVPALVGDFLAQCPARVLATIYHAMKPCRATSARTGSISSARR